MYLSLNRGTCGSHLPYDAFVKLAADAGFAAADAEFGYAVENGVTAMRDLFKSHNLRLGGWGLGDWQSDEPQHRDCLDALIAYAKVAAELGIDSCTTWIMPSSDRTFLENWKFHVERLKPAARILANNGLRLGLEFVSPYHLRRHFANEFLFTPGVALQLAEDIGPNVGLLVDAFHMHAAGESLEYLSTIFLEKIVLVHISDCAVSHLPDVKDAERVLPGDGVIDLKAFMAAVKMTGYDGPVSLEVFNHDLDKLPPAEVAAKARQACKTAAGL